MVRSNRKIVRKILSTAMLVGVSTTAYAETINVEAEDFVLVGGTYADGNSQPINVYSVNSEQAINFVNRGDYAEYDVVVATSGEYSVEYLVGTSITNGSAIELSVLVNGQWQSLGSTNVPLGQWDDFQSLTTTETVPLVQGTNRVKVTGAGSHDWQWNLESFLLHLETNQVTDTDIDGVADENDQCVNTPNGESVDAVGCSESQLDDDNDGVNNAIDQCPNTPSGDVIDSLGCTVVDTPVVGESFTIEMEAFDATGAEDSRAKGVIIGERGYPSDKHTVVDSVQTTDWVEYHINFATDGNYKVDMLASGQTTHATAILYVNGTQVNEVPVHTGSQAEFEEFTLADSVFIGSGTQTIRVEAGSSTGSFSWLWFGDALTFTNLDGNSGATDTDGDGVLDTADQCPNTPAGATVDTVGCEVVVIGDADNDGVLDNIDQCPNTAAGATVDAVGCEVVVIGDADNDGVLDNVDQCPSTPAGVTVDAVGCEVIIVIDTDNDGVEDGQDSCPNTPTGEPVNGQGCGTSQLDSDNDGVSDLVDQCPATPAGTAVDATGCEVDNGGSEGDVESGLMYSVVGNDAGTIINLAAGNLNWERTTDLAQTEDSIKGASTEIYTGRIYDADGHISFYENIDDAIRVSIDGVVVLSNDSWEESTQTADLNLTPGFHNIEIRLGNNDGGSGPVGGELGFGIDINGGTNFVHPSALSESIFTSSGLEIGNPDTPQEGDVIIQLEDFDATGTTGRVASDPNDGFVADAGATNVSWVTNGDWGDYNVTFEQPGTYRAYITVATPETGSFGARVDVNGEPVAWGYFESTGGWETSADIELYGGHFSIEQAGSATVRVEAIGGSDWQWSGDKVRFTRLGEYTPAPDRHYDADEHFIAEVEGPQTELTYLKRPVEIPADKKVLKSDVWYTYPQNRDWYDEANGGQPGDYADFGATGAFWGHPPEHDFYEDTVIMEWAIDVVDTFQNEGYEYTARGEFDWGYGWFTEYVTNPQPHYVQTLDDRNVRMTFMGYLSHNGYNNHWLSNHSPAFVPFMKSQVDQILKANPDKLMFDTQTNSTRSTDMRTFGGDFSPYAMENFRIWLGKKYSSSELAALGVTDVNTFDYKQHLLSLGVTHTSWSNAGDKIEGSIPLLEDFIYFNRDVWNQKFAEVLDYIREKQPDIEIGASTHLFESRGYIFNENITFLSGELNLGARTSVYELPTNILVHLKGAQAVDKTLAYFPYPWEFDELRLTDNARFGRGWVAQAYAYGGLFSIPANVWVGGEVWVWSPGADNYRDIYQFVRAQEHLFDSYTSYSKVGLVHAMYSSMKAGFIDGGNQVQSSVKLLTEDNINFDMLVFGDEGYPVVPRAEDFDKFDHVFFDGDLNYLTAAQQAVLDAQGDKVRHIGQRGTLDGLQINVSVNGAVSNETVSAVSRIHESNADAPYVVHLINRPFAGGVTPTLNGVEVAIPQNYFPADVTSATLHLPDGTSESLTLSANESGDTVVTVNNLEVWGMLELGH